MENIDWNNDKEEKELIESVERGEWESIENLKEEKKRYTKIFKASSKRGRRPHPTGFVHDV